MPAAQPPPAPGHAAEISEALIETQVRAFYARIQRDPELGPVFAGVVEDWEPHLARMCDFWSSVLLKTGRYKGNPMRMHAPLALRPPQFERWLRIFSETAAETCPPPAARLFIARANMIAESLSLAAAIARGEIPGRVPAWSAGDPI